MTDITPGRYKNTNTGIEFELEIDGDEVIMHGIGGPSDLEIRKPKIEFYINTQAAIPDDRTPTYELVEASESDPVSNTTAEV